jgi:hypothetical protein
MACNKPTNKLINNSANQNHKRGGSVRLHKINKTKLIQGHGWRQGLNKRCNADFLFMALPLPTNAKMEVHN